MGIDVCDFDPVHLLGEYATRPPAPRSTRHAALQILAIPPGIAAVCPCRARPNQRLGPFTPSKGAQAPLEPRRSPLPGTPITALASAFNYGF